MTYNVFSGTLNPTHFTSPASYSVSSVMSLLYTDRIPLPVNYTLTCTISAAHKPSETLVNKCSAVAEMGDRLATIDMGRKLGTVSLLGRGAGSPCNTMRPGPRSTLVPSCILIHPVVWPQQTWAEILWAVPLRGGVGSASNTILPTIVPSKWHLDPSSHLATTNMGRKLGVCPLLGGGEVDAYLAQCGLGRGLPSYQVDLIHAAIWQQQIWAENWGLCPFRGGELGPRLTQMWPWPRSTCTPSFILIHPTVWPQYTNVRDRTGQTTV